MDKLANRLANKHKTNNPFDICQNLGIHISFENLGECTRGIYYRRLRHRFIVINSNLNMIWQRFVCAHELGHDILHPGLNRFWLDQNTLFNPGKFERQANEFAFQLLSTGFYINPRESVHEFCLRTGIPAEMKQYYFEE